MKNIVLLLCSGFLFSAHADSLKFKEIASCYGKSATGEATVIIFDSKDTSQGGLSNLRTGMIKVHYTPYGYDPDNSLTHPRTRYSDTDIRDIGQWQLIAANKFDLNFTLKRGKRDFSAKVKLGGKLVTDWLECN